VDVITEREKRFGDSISVDYIVSCDDYLSQHEINTSFSSLQTEQNQLTDTGMSLRKQAKCRIFFGKIEKMVIL
jgi:hypothetical protein